MENLLPYVICFSVAVPVCLTVGYLLGIHSSKVYKQFAKNALADMNSYLALKSDLNSAFIPESPKAPEYSNMSFHSLASTDFGSRTEMDEYLIQQEQNRKDNLAQQAKELAKMERA